MCIIVLEDIYIYSNHGCMEEESVLGGEYKINLEVHYHYSMDINGDNINNVVNYVNLYDIILNEMKIRSNIIEHLACRILKKIYNYSKDIFYVKLKLSKTHPPINARIGAFTVIVQKGSIN